MALSERLKPSGKPYVLRATGSNVERINILPKEKTNCLSLYLSSNRLSNLRHIGQFKVLTELLMDYNNLQYVDDLEPLSKLRNLTVLHLEGNPLCRLPIWELHAIKYCPKLKVLNGSNVTSLPLSQYSRAEILQILNLEVRFHGLLLGCVKVSKTVKYKLQNPAVTFVTATAKLETSLFRDPNYPKSCSQKVRLHAVLNTSIDGYFGFMRQKLISKHQKLIVLMRKARVRQQSLTNYAALVQQLAACADFNEFVEVAERARGASLQQLDVGSGAELSANWEGSELPPSRKFRHSQTGLGNADQSSPIRLAGKPGSADVHSIARDLHDLDEENDRQFIGYADELKHELPSGSPAGKRGSSSIHNQASRPERDKASDGQKRTGKKRSRRSTERRRKQSRSRERADESKADAVSSEPGTDQGKHCASPPGSPPAEGSSAIDRERETLQRSPSNGASSQVQFDEVAIDHSAKAPQFLPVNQEPPEGDRRSGSEHGSLATGKPRKSKPASALTKSNGDESVDGDGPTVVTEQANESDEQDRDGDGSSAGNSERRPNRSAAMEVGSKPKRPSRSPGESETTESKARRQDQPLGDETEGSHGSPGSMKGVTHSPLVPKSGQQGDSSDHSTRAVLDGESGPSKTGSRSAAREKGSHIDGREPPKQSPPPGQVLPADRRFEEEEEDGNPLTSFTSTLSDPGFSVEPITAEASRRTDEPPENLGEEEEEEEEETNDFPGSRPADFLVGDLKDTIVFSNEEEEEEDTQAPIAPPSDSHGQPATASKLEPRASRESNKELDLSTDSFSSSRDKFEFEPIQGKRLVSFEAIEEITFFASRGGGESEFSGPPPRIIEIDHGDSQSSDFESSPNRPVSKRAQPQGLLQVQDDTIFDASRGESLFTASDLPVFDDPPVLAVSTSSEFEEKTKKKVVVFNPNIIQSQKRPVEAQPKNTRCVVFAMVSELSRAFSIWKLQIRRRTNQRPAVVPPPPMLRSSWEHPVESADRLNRSRPAERRLKDLAEKYTLIAQIERQKDVNNSLQARAEQIRSEAATTQLLSRGGSRTSQSVALPSSFRSRTGL